MATTRVGPKHQVTIPKEVFDRLRLEVGDLLEAEVERGKIVLSPKRLVEKAPAAKLSKGEQQVVLRARRKVEQIRKDPIHSRGLTRQEAELAAKVGLIDKHQVWWWLEEWQKGERQAERDIRRGKVKGFETVEDLIDDLRGAGG